MPCTRPDFCWPPCACSQWPLRSARAPLIPPAPAPRCPASGARTCGLGSSLAGASRRFPATSQARAAYHSELELAPLHCASRQSVLRRLVLWPGKTPPAPANSRPTWRIEAAGWTDRPWAWCSVRHRGEGSATIAGHCVSGIKPLLQRDETGFTSAHSSDKGTDIAERRCQPLRVASAVVLSSVVGKAPSVPSAGN
jgi:hypothetical protein